MTDLDEADQALYFIEARMFPAVSLTMHGLGVVHTRVTGDHVYSDVCVFWREAMHKSQCVCNNGTVDYVMTVCTVRRSG